MTHFVKSRAKILKIGINSPTSKFSLVFINNSAQDRTEITLETFFTKLLFLFTEMTILFTR